MLGRIKDVITIFLTPLALILGYGLLALLFILGTIAVGTIICLMLIETLFNPNILVFGGDLLLVVLMILIVRSKKFKRALKSFGFSSVRICNRLLEF